MFWKKGWEKEEEEGEKKRRRKRRARRSKQESGADTPQIPSGGIGLSDGDVFGRRIRILAEPTYRHEIL
jgi:hypothetical protein